MEQPKACTGDFRVHRGKWTTPVGMTPQQCTYCEWCITNKCVQLEEGYTVRQDLNNCLCDCPIKHTHASIQTYNCGQHEDGLSTCDMRRCRTCFRSNALVSGEKTYCGACSALFGICEICGITPDGKHPERPRTKMISTQNGRAGFGYFD